MTFVNTRSVLVTLALGFGALSVWSAGCGASTSSTTDGGTGGRTGTGGSTTGTGGSTTGTGGSTTGTGGSTTGTGGAGGSTSALCTGVAPSAPLITDFSDAMTPDGGAAGTILLTIGGTYTYAGATATVTGGALAVGGTIPMNMYAGVGIYFNNCTDATSYMGVRFTITGSFGTCDMTAVGASFPQDQRMTPDMGACTPVPPADCYGPSAPFTATTMMVPFSAMVGGMPIATVIPEAQSRIRGINFGFHAPATASCMPNFTIDNVSFY